ncbi:MAG: hypothetical protein H0T42_22505 [Deltaproteobacteria bacterium]|nr:hypothetical protein [Deltaproteobacteria bacterium]
MKLAAAIVLATVLAASPARAQPDCTADADRLRAHLEQADRATFRWNTTWAILFGTAAVGQVVLAVTEIKPFGTFDAATRDTYYVGATKATLALATRVFTPLRVSIPAPSADRCSELIALRASLSSIANKERQGFWLGHLGGFVLNVAASGLLWHRHSFNDGALSFAMSFPVGLASTYTMPRRSWHLYRAERASWSVGLAIHSERTMFSLSGEI